MTPDEVANERLKLEIELEKAKADTIAKAADNNKSTITFWTLVVTAVVGPLIVLLGQWINGRYQLAATSKVEATTIASADDIKKTHAADTDKVEKKLESHDETLDDLKSSAVASVQSWKAYHTKDEGDMNVANQTLQEAERMLTTPQKQSAVPTAVMPK